MTLVAGEIDFDGASRAGGAGREIRLVAVPTTLSAGEFTPGGGVTDEATRVKRRVADARLQHRTVIYDPELCLNTPDWLWVATGMRALDHAIEGIYSTRAQPFTDALGAEAIRLMMAHLPGSVGGGSDRLAERGWCQIAAWHSFFGGQSTCKRKGRSPISRAPDQRPSLAGGRADSPSRTVKPLGRLVGVLGA